MRGGNPPSTLLNHYLPGTLLEFEILRLLDDSLRPNTVSPDSTSLAGRTSIDQSKSATPSSAPEFSMWADEIFRVKSAVFANCFLLIPSISEATKSNAKILVHSVTILSQRSMLEASHSPYISDTEGKLDELSSNIIPTFVARSSVWVVLEFVFSCYDFSTITTSFIPTTWLASADIELLVDLASTTLGRLLFFASPLYKSVITIRCRRYNTRYGSLTTAAKGLLASSEVEAIWVSWPSAPTARIQSANHINDLSDWSILTLTHFLLGQRILLVALWAALCRKWAYLIWDERAASTHIQTLVRQF